LRSVNVRYDDLVSLTFIFHFWSHLLKIWRYSCSVVEARKTFVWLVRIAVSSANVPIVTLGACGR